MDKTIRMGEFIEGTSNELGFDPSIMLDYSFDDGLFSILYDIKANIGEQKIKQILRLVDKFYPQSTFKEDWFIESKSRISLTEYIEHYFVYRQGSINDIVINISVYVQSIDGKLFLGTTEEAGIEIICDESGEEPIYGITVYPYVYFDKSTLPNIGKVINQDEAAKRNRKILREFMMSLERLLEAKPLEISSYHPHYEKYIYEYGVKEGAKYLL